MSPICRTCQRSLENHTWLEIRTCLQEENRKVIQYWHEVLVPAEIEVRNHK